MDRRSFLAVLLSLSAVTFARITLADAPKRATLQVDGMT